MIRRLNKTIRGPIALGLVFLLSSAPVYAGLEIVGANGITVSGADGIIYTGTNGITVSGADGVLAFQPNGITVSGAGDALGRLAGAPRRQRDPGQRRRPD